MTMNGDTKRCSCCRETRPVTEFHKARRSPDGLQDHCKPCRGTYRSTHREAINAARRQAYGQAQKQRHAEYIRAYSKKHRESLSLYHRAYREAHREELNAAQRAYHDTRRAVEAEYARAYYASEQGRLVKNACIHRRMARERGAVGSDYTTAKHIAWRHALWGNRCYICGKAGSKTSPLHTDHVKPLAKGGAHLPCNLRPICGSCNTRKRDAWPYAAVLSQRGNLTKGEQR